jgi:Flp pilus assembly protein CpaB
VKSRLLAITLAVVLAVVGIVAVLAYVRQANDRAVNGLKAETVMVAAEAIPAGTSLSKAQQGGMLSTEKVPESSLTTPAVQSVTAANEHEVVTGTVPKGEVLLQNMVAPAGTITAGSNIPALPLPQGDIGVTMEMCLDTDVAGYVQPGSYIVVFDTVAVGGTLTYTCTSHQSPTNGGKVATYVVDAKVEVLSVTPAGPQSTSSASGQAAADVTNPGSVASSVGEVLVTLAATNQAEAQNLILASSAGYPAFGLLTKGSQTSIDVPVTGISVQSQPGT